MEIRISSTSNQSSNQSDQVDGETAGRLQRKALCEGLRPFGGRVTYYYLKASQGGAAEKETNLSEYKTVISDVQTLMQLSWEYRVGMSLLSPLNLLASLKLFIA